MASPKALDRRATAVITLCVASLHSMTLPATPAGGSVAVLLYVLAAGAALYAAAHSLERVCTSYWQARGVAASLGELTRQGKHEEAERKIGEARRHAVRAWPFRRYVTQVVEIAAAEHFCAVLRLDEAETACRKALDLAKTKGRRCVGLHVLGRILALQRRYDEALTAAREAVEQYPAPDAFRLQIKISLAAILGDARRFQEAGALIDEVIAHTARATSPLGRCQHADALHVRSVLESARGNSEEALRLRIAEVGIRDTEGEEGTSLTLLGSLVSLAAQYCDTQRYDDAERTARRVLSLTERGDGAYHRPRGAAMVNLAHALRHLGRFAEAEQAARDALHHCRQSGGGLLGLAYDVLAEILVTRGSLAEADALYRDSIGLQRSAPLTVDRLEETLDRYADLCDQLGRHDQAMALRSQAESHRQELRRAWS